MAVRIMYGSWWVDFRFNHTRYRKRSPDNSRAGAKAYELTLRQRLARGEPVDGIIVNDERFETFAEKWFEDYVKPNNRFLEQRAKRYILSSCLMPFFGKKRLRDINVWQIEHFKASQIRIGVSAKTLKNRLTVLNKCLVSAYEWLMLPGAPPKIAWPRCGSCRTDYLSAEECERLLTSADGIVREMILLSLRTGMRQGEIKGLQWNCIDWQTRSVAIRHSLCDHGKVLGPPKGNRERHIPLDADAYEILYRRRKTMGFVFTDAKGEPFNDPRLNRRLERACRRAGLRRITWHILRHTFASQLAIRGVPLHVVQALLGHSSITTTMRYAHVAPSALRPAIDMLNPKRLTNAASGQGAVNDWVETQLSMAA